MAGEKTIDKINLDNIAAGKRAVLEGSGDSNQVEKLPESSIEKKKIEKVEKNVKIENQPITQVSSDTDNTQVQSFQKKRALEIDNILSEGLHEVFLKMTPARQKEFKIAGEETVSKISALLDKGKVKVSKIIGLIKNWLKLIPGVNKFFLEQEAKIKADKIMNIKNN
ncbi:MAG: hypothetical protein WCT50_05005 [Patescibacteria group bacterium]